MSLWGGDRRLFAPPPLLNGASSRWLIVVCSCIVPISQLRPPLSLSLAYRPTIYGARRHWSWPQQTIIVFQFDQID